MLKRLNITGRVATVSGKALECVLDSQTDRDRQAISPRNAARLVSVGFGSSTSPLRDRPSGTTVGCALCTDFRTTVVRKYLFICDTIFRLQKLVV